MQSDRQVAGRLLDAVLRGELAPESAEAQWPDADTGDRSLSAANHALQHYRSQAGQRAGDPEFAAMQVTELRYIADSLMSDKDLDPAIVDGLEPLPPRWLSRVLGGDDE